MTPFRIEFPMGNKSHRFLIRRIDCPVLGDLPTCTAIERKTHVLLATVSLGPQAGPLAWLECRNGEPWDFAIDEGWESGYTNGHRGGFRGHPTIKTYV
jgi:hypothetical protein